MRLRRALAALSLVLSLSAVAMAQEEPPPPPDKDADWRAGLERGLDLMRARKLPEAIRIFEQCILLYPERGIAYYNLACARSLSGKADDAVKALKAAIEKGFNDVAHMARDKDLEPIRGDAGFKALLAETRKKIVDTTKLVLRAPAAGGEGKPLVVWLHDDGETADAVVNVAWPVLESAGVVLCAPEGRVRGDRGGARWDVAAEVAVLHAVDVALAQQKADPKRVFLVGGGDGATRAAHILAKNFERFRGAALAFGFYERLEAAPAAGSRFFLVSPPEGDPRGDMAVALRDALVEKGAAVVHERDVGTGEVPRGKLLPRRLEKGLRFLLGEAAPSAGGTRKV